MPAAASAPPAAFRGVVREWRGGRGAAGVSLEVAAGEIVALIGPNGSGKTTLLRLLAGEIEPDRGAALAFGAAPGRAARRRMGVVFQETAVDDLMRVRETLALFAALHEVPRDARRARIDQALEAAGLSDRAGDPCGSLSGGLRRRLDIQRALLHRPELLILDEPTLSLDLDSVLAIHDQLRGARDSGSAVLLSTNNVQEAEALADRVAFLADGRVIALGPPAALTAGLRDDSVILQWPDCTEEQAAEIERWPAVGGVRRAQPDLHVTVDSAAAFLPAAFERFGGAISGVRIRQSSLADAWFQLAGSALESADGAS